MSYPLRSYMSQGAATSSSSLEKSSLLTPPLTPLAEHEVPYKPNDSDSTSLNLKKKRHYHDEDTREVRRIDSESGMETRQLDEMMSDEQTRKRTDFARSKTFCLAYPDRVDDVTSHASVINHHNKSAQKQGNTRSRRWTLPSKSTATRSVTPLRSTVKQSTSKQGSESPAIITLRRATTSRSAKQTELTFFPEPKFGNQKSGLFSYLVSTLTGSDNIIRCDKSALLSSLPSDSGPTSKRRHGTHPTMTFPAPTVYTETTVETDLAMPGLPIRDAFLRRCSTKYISGGSTYEIIWDENDISTSSQHSSEQFVRLEDRRPSQAVMKLKARLSRDQSRRSSDCSSASSNRTSVGSEKMFLDRVLTPEKLRQALPRLFHKSSLRDLPISKSFQQFNRSSSHPTTTGDVSRRYLVEDNPRIPAGSIEFFPPLQSRKASIIEADFVEFDGRRGTTASITPPSPRQIRFGSLVGSSSHTRRRGSALPDKQCNRNSEALEGKARVSSVSAVEFLGHDSDTQPLLGKKSNGKGTC